MKNIIKYNIIHFNFTLAYYDDSSKDTYSWSTKSSLFPIIAVIILAGPLYYNSSTQFFKTSNDL